MQKRAPLFVVFEVFSDVLGKENVAGVAAIHYPLRDVEASARKIGPFVYIRNGADWPAVDSHPKLQARMLLERAADLHGALRRRFRIRVKYQRHPIAHRNPN